jgi:methyl-accepting chemotaxis protein
VYNLGVKLMAKFNLIFFLVFGIAVAIAGLILYSLFQDHARKHVHDQAELMMNASLAVREYTSKEIDGVIQTLPGAEREFHPQMVPSYEANEDFEYLQSNQDSSKVSYREVALNPSNWNHRPSPWEGEIIETFQNDPTREYEEVRSGSPLGLKLVLAKPIVAEQACLRCHDAPEKAPAAMNTKPASKRGFGWKLNQVVGARIVSVPMAVPVRMANESFRSTMLALILLALSIVAALDVALAVFVVKPVFRVAQMADEISKGNRKVPELPVRGVDEISILTRAFNRMQVSLAKALDMLDPKS